jgi:hypothetical protein
MKVLIKGAKLWQDFLENSGDKNISLLEAFQRCSKYFCKIFVK